MAVTLALALHTAPSRAQPAVIPPPADLPDARLEEAKALFRQGVALLEAGKLEPALDRFLRSRELVPSGRNTANAAICLERLGRYDEALDLFEDLHKYHSADLSAADRATLLPVVEGLRGKVGRLTLTGDVPGAEVHIDGRSRGRLPLAGPIRIRAGERRVSIAKGGYDTIDLTIDVTGGGSTTLSVHMSRSAEGPPPAPAEPPKAPKPKPRTASSELPPVRRLVVESYDRWLPVTLYRIENVGMGTAYEAPSRLRAKDHDADMSARLTDVNIVVEKFVCVVPCDVSIPTETREYYLGGEGIPPSAPFELGGYGTVGIRASPGDQATKNASIALLSVGTTGAFVGLVTVAAAGGSKSTMTAGGVVTGLSAALIALGAPLYLKARTTWSFFTPEGVRF